MMNVHVWESYGLNEEGMQIANAIMPLMLQIVTRVQDRAILAQVLNEAYFQIVELPKRDPDLQNKSRWRPDPDNLLSGEDDAK